MAPSSPLAKGPRLLHLDALRSFCMFFGVLVHAATIDYGARPLFEFVREASDLFRMATFFVISGYFTAMVYLKRPGRAYFQNRTVLLVIPLMSALLLVNPVANWLIYCWYNTEVSLYDYTIGGIWQQPATGNTVWHLQMWFLFSLVVYAALTPLFVAVAKSRLWARGMDGLFRLFKDKAIWVVALKTGIAILILQGFNTAVLLPITETTWYQWIVNATVRYMPWFLLGVFAFLDKRLYRALHEISLPGLVLSGAAYAAVVWLGADLPVVVERVLFWISRSMLTLFIIAALFGLFERMITRPSRVLSFAVESAFSFYIFHFAVIYAVAALARNWADNIYVIYAVILLLAPPLTLAIHGFLIAPVPLLRLMFNGKRKARAAAPRQTVPEGR